MPTNLNARRKAEAPEWQALTIAAAVALLMLVSAWAIAGSEAVETEWYSGSNGAADMTVDQRGARPSILITAGNLRELSTTGVILPGHVIARQGRSRADDATWTVPEGEDAMTRFRQRADAYADRNS